MQRLSLLILLLILAGCGGSALPPTPVAFDASPLPLRPLGEIGRGDYDGTTITVIAPVIQRAAARTLVPALSFGSPEPQPLLTSPNESVLLGGDPLTDLTPVPADGSEYGVVRATGIVQLTADGVRQLQPSAVKVIAPASVSIGDLQANLDHLASVVDE